MNYKNNKIHINTYNSLALEYKQNLKIAKSIKKESTGMLFKYLRKDDKVLDIGCAVGYDSKMLSRKFLVTGIDISPRMVKIAKELNKNNTRVIIKKGDFLSKKFTKKFNGIFAHAFIHLFPTGTDSKVFKKMFDILNQGGVAYIATTPNKKTKEGFYIKKDYKIKEKRFRKHWNKQDLQKIIKKIGFSIVEYKQMTDPFGKKWMVFILKKLENKTP